jgi:glycosyltransferase involved in cell wall biosynthesis
MPKFSIITPVYNTPLSALRSCIASVKAQTFQDWEWCMVDDASPNSKVHAVLRKAAVSDPRIRVAFRGANGGIVAASQDALDMATGEFIALLDHDDELHPQALAKVAQRLAEDELVDYVYTDEDKIDNDGNHYDVFKKPAFDPVRLAAQNYCCHFSVFRSSLLDDIGGFRKGFDGSQDFDLILRATERARRIAHIGQVLYHWRAIPGSAASVHDAKPYAFDSAVKATKEHMARTNQQADVWMSDEGFIQIRPKMNESPRVSIVIPTRGDAKRIWGVHTCLVEHAVNSILRQTTYANYEIVVVHDYKDGAPIYNIDLGADPRVKVVPYQAPFNFSDKCNVGVKASSGDVIVLLNDDVQLVSPDWLETFVAMLQYEGVGMVGPMLLLEDGRIQSAGHTNIPTPHNLGSGLSSKSVGSFGMFALTRRVSGVTAACAAISRDVYEELGGFSIDFPACFNDLDFCYKLTESGRHIVWTPLVRLYHFESLTRDPTVQPHEMQMLERRWKRMFGKEDYTRQSA